MAGALLAAGSLAVPLQPAANPRYAAALVSLQTAILFAQQGAKVVCSDLDAANSQASTLPLRGVSLFSSCGVNDRPAAWESLELLLYVSWRLMYVACHALCANRPQQTSSATAAARLSVWQET